MTTQPDSVFVGQGATYYVGSDSYAYTVIEMSANGKNLVLQEDRVRRVDSNGLSECQDYAIERDPNGQTMRVSLRKDGAYRQVGSNHGKVILGARVSYRNPSF